VKTPCHWARLAVRLVNHVFPEVRFDTWDDCQHYLPHAQHCATLIAKYQLTLKEGALLLERLGTYRFQQAAYAEAETHLTQALKLYEHHLREELYQQALAVGEQALGSEHPDVALFLNNLAFLANKQEQYQKAEPLYQRALSIYERTQGLQHPDMALFLNNLARFYRNVQNEERAESLLRRALAIQKQLLDPTDPDITLSLNNLADVLIDQQRDEEAAPLLYRAFAILLLGTSGPEHPHVESVREKYASLLERLHRDEEAKELLPD